MRTEKMVALVLARMLLAAWVGFAATLVASSMGLDFQWVRDLGVPARLQATLGALQALSALLFLPFTRGKAQRLRDED